ncbi:hypothetical protein CLIM01_10907 [Colletotrichum limetticola]|uniref:Uncharacterized protein n=1 Tax=Colletotrichum limetticola TaxID=1209924 RepID=A0ABQ9PLD3_9PEZI|nr:hypothetical protein CLIM01_10907 [Colletotrichum limetticola]
MSPPISTIHINITPTTQKLHKIRSPSRSSKMQQPPPLPINILNPHPLVLKQREQGIRIRHKDPARLDPRAEGIPHRRPKIPVFEVHVYARDRHQQASHRRVGLCSRSVYGDRFSLNGSCTLCIERRFGRGVANVDPSLVDSFTRLGIHQDLLADFAGARSFAIVHKFLKLSVQHGIYTGTVHLRLHRESNLSQLAPPRLRFPNFGPGIDFTNHRRYC